MQRITRRSFLQAAAGTALMGASALTTTPVAANPPPGPFTLPRLAYANNALVAAIDEQTMMIHHDRHHQAYVTNLNAALQGQDALARMGIEAILRDLTRVPEASRMAVRNNGGGHYNHSMFW